MKITVVCKTNEWQVEQLKAAARKNEVDLEVIDLSSPEEIPENLGEVTLWRSSSLGGGEKRLQAMRAILDKSILINRCLAVLPEATEKSFQQEYVIKKTSSINCIKTFLFQTKDEFQKAIERKDLRFPCIAKPNKGSKGEGVMLIENIDAIDHSEKPITEMVFQNFIKNTGDYRIFVLGGRVLGVIKRTAKEGGFLNNISKGGSAEAITDKRTIATLRKIGTTVASIFQLTICGVDVIYDEIEQKFFFLEVNTVPQWKGFQEATNIDVAQEIILFCKRMSDRKTKPVLDLVEEEYTAQIHLLREKQFHFLSRMYLWTGEQKYKNLLDGLKKSYIGDTAAEHERILRKIYATRVEHGDRMVAKEARMKYFKKYPALEPCLNLLFKNLFAKKLYNIDLRPIIKKIVADSDLLALKEKLEEDTEALQILSTHAINYLYLLESYLETSEGQTNPNRYLEIGSSYLKNTFELQIYFFTHCIIGASRFYSEKIVLNDLPVYDEMLKRIEHIIREHFQKISLDNKFEFLVCARLCGFRTSIENEILAEASRSLSPDGNFLIDRENAHAAPEERNDFVGSEHRNVLFIMSQSQYR